MTKIEKRGKYFWIDIPKEVLKKYNLKGKEEVDIIPDKDCIKIVPA